MKYLKKIILVFIVFLVIFKLEVYAHGGNIKGWKDNYSEYVIENNGKYFGYHNQSGIRHYHEVKWNVEKQKWEIVNSAVCYDEKLNIINNVDLNEERLEVKYNKHVDGDTAKFELNGEIITVRFLGINTPETVDKTRGEEPYGKEASNYTKEKLEKASKIEIAYDSNSAQKDKYGRDLAWIWVDNNLLQKELVENGLAETYLLQDNYRYAGVLQLAEGKAKQRETRNME